MNFLTAHWQDLIVINYEIPKELVEARLPLGCEVDTFNDKCFASLVFFQFKNCKVLGLPWPGYRDFSEINLRLYVKFTVNNEERRGVIFVKEYVPKRLIAFIAQKFYREPYYYSKIDYQENKTANGRELSYHWQNSSISVESPDSWQNLKADSQEEFILEHYWGYNDFAPTQTAEYEVKHPSWQASPLSVKSLDLDFIEIYGSDWSFLNIQDIHSAFIAKGSEISVSNKKIYTKEKLTHTLFRYITGTSATLLACVGTVLILIPYTIYIGIPLNVVAIVLLKILNKNEKNDFFSCLTFITLFITYLGCLLFIFYLILLFTPFLN